MCIYRTILYAPVIFYLYYATINYCTENNIIMSVTGQPIIIMISDSVAHLKSRFTITKQLSITTSGSDSCIADSAVSFDGVTIGGHSCISKSWTSKHSTASCASTSS